MKNYSDDFSVGKLRSIKFSDNSNHTWVNNPCQSFVTKFLSAADSVLPIRILRVKSNTKPGFNINVLNAIENRDKHYKKSTRSVKEIDKSNFNYAKLLLKKVIDKKKKNF